MILLDTHVVFWLGFDLDRISSRAMRAIREVRESGRALAASVVSLYELANLAQRDRVQLRIPVSQFLENIEKDFVILPLNSRIAGTAAAFRESYPKDPMDRMIGATALIEGLELITADDRIRRSGLIRTIW